MGLLSLNKHFMVFSIYLYKMRNSYDYLLISKTQQDLSKYKNCFKTSELLGLKNEQVSQIVCCMFHFPTSWPDLVSAPAEDGPPAAFAAPLAET